MDVVVAKIISLLILTTLTVLSGLLPCRLMHHFAKSMSKRKAWIDYILSGMRCYSGGVFLGTCFLHLIPETRTKVDEVLEQLGSRSTYPVAELLTMAGFFGVIFIEHIIKLVYKKVQEETDRDSLYSNDMEWIPTTEDPLTSGMNLANNLETGSKNSISNHETNCTIHNMTENNRRTRDFSESEIEPAPLQEIEVKTMVTELNRADDSTKGNVRSIVFITALSFHGVFEGMALGLQSLETNVWVLCFAIVIHRGILSFGLGLQHSRNEERHGTIIFTVSTFAILAAVGIIIGLAISTGAQLYSDVNVPNAILQSLATGTIFYIIFFDILYKDINGQKDIKKISCTFVGFSLMAIIFAITRQ